MTGWCAIREQIVKLQSNGRDDFVRTASGMTFD
jgi:hypothetical protein